MTCACVASLPVGRHYPGCPLAGRRRAGESPVSHHGFLIDPGAHGCLCGMPDPHPAPLRYEGGDCRSLGCDECCPRCSSPDEARCPDPAACAGLGSRERLSA
jgi:hypothetical protein